MENQLRTEVIQEPVYLLPTGGQTEIGTAEAQGAHSAAALDTWLANAQRKIHRSKLRTAGITVGMGICAFVPVLLGGMLSPTVLEYVFGADMLVLGLLFVMGFTSFSRKPIWTAAELEQIGGVRAVGALIDLGSIPGAGRDLDAMQKALTGLLLQMQEGDAGLLNAEHRTALYRLLDYGAQPRSMTATHEAYLIAIIKAFAHIGDAEALRRITHLSSGQAITRFQQTIKAAAQECLPLLKARLALQSANTTLLRGASREQSSPEILLRPAAQTPDTDRGHLLVASDIPEDRKEYTALE